VPMIELTTTKGALDDAAKQRLAGELSTIALELEAAPLADFGDAAHMQALAWCFVNEQEVFVGGQAHAKPIYRVTVTIPEGAPGVFGPLAKRGREKLVKRVTAAVLAAEGSENTMVEAHRIWVHLRQITDGHWAGFGEVVTLPELAAYGLKTDEPESKTGRMREAAMQSVGALSTAQAKLESRCV
jgi:phenylpyruvate tautomerase PptA (4-oxalocrotonate tautomerase family)